MLSIGAMGNGQGSYYVDLAAEDYYLKGGEPPGQWIGEGAALLGLSGPGKNGQVDPEQFLKLFRGFDAGGKALVQNAGASNRQPGWDLTFSAPKSVSTVWAVCDAETREAIQAAHFAAVKAAVSFLEEGATTRRGKGGDIKEAAKLLVATFEHGTSRAQDPQLHTHALILNMAVRLDGTTGALESQHYYRCKMAAGALYRAELSRQLQGLGFEIEREKTTFEIKGVIGALMEEFSKRRAEIEAHLEKQGKHSARASAVAALATRTVKEHRARGELLREWQEIAKAYGFTNQTVQELKRFAPTRGPQVELREAVALAIEKISADKSHFGAHELIRATAEEAQGRGVSAAQVRAGVKDELQKLDYVRLGEHKGQTRYTTHELWQTERALLRGADSLREDKSHQVDHRHYLYGMLRAEQRAARRAQEKEKERDPQAFALGAFASGAPAPQPMPQMSSPVMSTPVMSDEQRQALSYLTKETGSIALVSGVAGSGKTFLLDAARETWEAQGFKVIGASVAGRAARGLQEDTGIKSTTVTRLTMEWERGFELTPSEKFTRKVERLHATWQIDSKTRRELLAPLEVPKSKAGSAWQYATWQISKSQKELLDKQIERRERFQLDAKTVLVVDEAGMLGTRQMAALIAKASEVGAKLVCIGQQSQIQSVEAGGPFGSLHKRHDGAEMKNIIRQKEAWQREAILDFSEGRAERALRAYLSNGCFTVADDREGAKRSLIEAWKGDGITAPQKNFILAGTRAETKNLNRLAQDERRRAGKLGFRSLKVAGETFHEKDRILFTKNSQVLGVQNGTTGTIKEVNPRTKTLRVKLDSGQETLVPCREYQDLLLGYALTTHKSQGMTVDNSFVLCGGTMTDRELSYVQASRARHNTKFFTGKIMAWNPDTQQREEATLRELGRQMSQSRQKDLAHDLALPAQDPAPEPEITSKRQRPELKPRLDLVPIL